MLDSIETNSGRKNNSHLWKKICMATGAVAGAYIIYDNKKSSQQIDEFLSSDAGNAVNNCKNFDDVKTIINESNIMEKIKRHLLKGIEKARELGDNNACIQDFLGVIKSNKRKTIMFVNFILLALMGLGIGAIIDTIRNHKNNHKNQN